MSNNEKTIRRLYEAIKHNERVLIETDRLILKIETSD
jgi:hypothetical protein